MLLINLVETEKDKEEFRLLYEKYNKLVYYIAMQHLNDRGMAEDCQQEVFLYIAKKFEHVRNRSTDDSVKGFITTITKAIAIDMYRKNKKNSAISYDDISSFVDTSRADLSLYNEIELSCAIDKLPDEYKNIIYLKYFYNFSSYEISDLYGISPSLVRKKIMVAKKIVKKYLQG